MVSDCYLPRLGGIEVQVAELSTRLRERGAQVAVLTATPPGHDAADAPADPAEHGVARLLPPIPMPAPINPWAGPELRRLMAGADVVHVHLGVMAPFATQAARLALEAGLPTVITWHSILGGPSAHLLRWQGRWARWVKAGAIPTAVGEHLVDQLRPVIGGDGAAVPIEVLPNGVDVDRWRNPAPTPADGPVRIMCANRFARRRRPFAVVNVMRRIRDLVRDLGGDGGDAAAIEVEIAGSGPLLGPVRQWVRAEGLEGWVSLPGRLERSELAARYHRSHLYLTPSRTESFGIAALEARTAGLPVAGLAAGGLRDFVTDEVTGIMAADDDDLVRRSAALIADRSRLTAMGELVRTTEPDQAWPNVLDITTGIYERAIDAQRGRRG